MSVSVLGGGGHARVIIDILRKQDIRVRAYYDDNTTAELDGIRCAGPMPSGVISSCEIVILWLRFICAIGDNKLRREIVENMELNRMGIEWITAIHPRAILPTGPKEIWEGWVICAGAIIQPGATIGKHTIINSGAIIEHDCQIGDFCDMLFRLWSGSAAAW